MTFIRLTTRALGFLGDESRLGAMLALAGFSLAAAQFAEPMLFGRIVDALAGAQGAGRPPLWNDVVTLLAAWVSFGLFTITCGALVALHADRLAHRRRHAVMTEYFEHAVQLPLSFHRGMDSGRLMKVMLAGTDSLWWIWLGFFREHLAAFVLLLVMLPLSLLINWRLATLLMALCIIFAGLTALALRKAEAGQNAVEHRYSDLAERTSDALSNVALVQSYSRVEAEVTGLRNLVAGLLGAQMPVLSWWAICAVLTRASTTITVLAIFATGVWLNMQGLASVGEIVTFTTFGGLLMVRLEQAVGFTSRLFQDRPRLTEFFAVADTVPTVRDRSDAIDPGRLHGLVEFFDVSYSYDGKRAAVSGLKFTALPGETVALVGATGAGKSTALALLHRAFDPQSGSVKIDGMDIRGVTLDGLRRNIGVVFQEVLLFNRSIGDNLRIGRPDATDAELREAAARAEALDFIDANPDGLQASVGEHGRMLSGGERQRLAIARALVKNPPILILDEATGALDAATEVRVQAALDELMKERTTFVIAHRLATVRNASRILVFDQGRIVETGSFDELIARGGTFAALAKARFLWSNDAPAPAAKAESADDAVVPPPNQITDAAE